jgi:hypothetical protein
MRGKHGNYGCWVHLASLVFPEDPQDFVQSPEMAIFFICLLGLGLQLVLLS